jgi:hypothetical protein
VRGVPLFSQASNSDVVSAAVGFLTDVFAVIAPPVQSSKRDIWGQFVVGCMERVADLRSELFNAAVPAAAKKVAEHSMEVCELARVCCVGVFLVA